MTRKNQNNRNFEKQAMHFCSRSPAEKEIYLSDMGFDFSERVILEIARFYWQTFAVPESQSWLRALQVAENNFGTQHGSDIGLTILAAVQAMRISRSSCFQFNNPNCAACSKLLCEHERLFMSAYRALKDGREGSARTHAMLLCEGNDIERLICELGILASSLYLRPLVEIGQISGKAVRRTGERLRSDRSEAKPLTASKTDLGSG